MLKKNSRPKIVMDYFNKLCYYLLETESLIGGNNMQEATIKSFYEQLNDCADKNSSIIDRIHSFFESYYYYNKLKRAAKEKNCQEFIIKNKDICNGKPVIFGTRIEPIIVMRIMFLNTSSIEERIEEIKKEYPSLDENLILMAILYYIKSTSFIKFLKQI
ncbi:MAG: DUF433 domain-containing protein [Ruminococcus sp.]|nr:DUF433 domain-containing protein [Ruminococcus sp.]